MGITDILQSVLTIWNENLIKKFKVKLFIFVFCLTPVLIEKLEYYKQIINCAFKTLTILIQ